MTGDFGSAIYDDRESVLRPAGRSIYATLVPFPIACFVGTFLTADGHARGRPVGIAVDKTGALLICDDLADKVWRVSPAEKQAAR